jgi:hypothetical protein
MEFVIKIKTIFNFLKNDVTLGIFGGIVSSPNDKKDAKGRLYMPMRKTKGSNYFEMSKG